jgi:hypothetical protein
MLAMIAAHGGNCTEARRAAEQNHDVHAGLEAWDAAAVAYGMAGGCLGCGA